MDTVILYERQLKKKITKRDWTLLAVMPFVLRHVPRIMRSAAVL